jgi:hypothetical protein
MGGGHQPPRIAVEERRVAHRVDGLENNKKVVRDLIKLQPLLSCVDLLQVGFPSRMRSPQVRLHMRGAYNIRVWRVQGDAILIPCDPGRRRETLRRSCFDLRGAGSIGPRCGEELAGARQLAI